MWRRGADELHRSDQRCHRNIQEQALGHADRALRADSSYFSAWNNLGTVYGSLGRYDEAERCFREALRLRPDHANAWYNIGLLRVVRRDRAGVLEAARRLAPLDRDQADALIRSADAISHGDTVRVESQPGAR